MMRRSLIPWHRRSKPVPIHREMSPFLSLRRELDDVFGEFLRDFDLAPSLWGFGAQAFEPSLDVHETEDEIQVSVELPGVEEKDIEVSVSEEALTIRGQKSQEREHSERGAQWQERSYGSFERTLPLPPGVEVGKAEARFQRGVLTVTLPKSQEAQRAVRRLEVKGE